MHRFTSISIFVSISIFRDFSLFYPASQPPVDLYIYTCISICLSIYLSIYLYIYICVCVCVCVSVYTYLSIYRHIYPSIPTYLSLYGRRHRRTNCVSHRHGQSGSRRSRTESCARFLFEFRGIVDSDLLQGGIAGGGLERCSGFRDGVVRAGARGGGFALKRGLERGTHGFGLVVASARTHAHTHARSAHARQIRRRCAHQCSIESSPHLLRKMKMRGHFVAVFLRVGGAMMISSTARAMHGRPPQRRLTALPDTSICTCIDPPRLPQRENGTQENGRHASSHCACREKASTAHATARPNRPQHATKPYRSSPALPRARPAALPPVILRAPASITRRRSPHLLPPPFLCLPVRTNSCGRTSRRMLEWRSLVGLLD